MKRYIITGGLGFVGSHLVEKLVKLNHRVIIIDNFSSGKTENIKKCGKWKNANIKYQNSSNSQTTHHFDIKFEFSIKFCVYLHF